MAELIKAETINAPWQGMITLPVARQLGLLIGLAVSIALGISVALWVKTPGYTMLYSQLESRDAKDVVTALNTAGIEYKINAETGALMVVTSKIHEARLALAAQGLPRQAGDGFELLEKGEILLTEYADSFQKLKPLEVEMEFRLPLVNTFTGELVDKDIVGKIDMISEDGEIYELKTGSSSLPLKSVDENLQLILYGWSFKMLFGKAPQKLVLVNLIKTKKPKIQVLDTTIDEQKEKKLMHLMFRVNEAIEKECFYPNPRGMFGCGGCSYGVSCEYVF